MGSGITWQREGRGDVRGWGKLDAWTAEPLSADQKVPLSARYAGLF